MHARSALFDLYGDYLRARDGRATVAALVRILAAVGVGPAAVRTAVSRMVRQGWLTPVRLGGSAGYALTDRARHRLDEAGSRIYGQRTTRWDGGWDLLVLGPLPHRSARTRLRAGLAYLGYAPLSDSTWIGPVRSPEVTRVLHEESATAARFRAVDDDPCAQAAKAWDLAALAAAYTSWQRQAAALVTRPQLLLGPLPADADERAFAVRFHLVHEWRKFLFRDPGLPPELLPPDWPGATAARFFTQEAARLLPAAARFVDGRLDAAEPNETERR